MIQTKPKMKARLLGTETVHDAARLLTGTHQMDLRREVYHKRETVWRVQDLLFRQQNTDPQSCCSHHASRLARHDIHSSEDCESVLVTR